MAAQRGFGVDIGGSWIKGGPVDLSTGKLAEQRSKIATPRPSRPEAVADVVAELVAHFSWRGPVGITLPCVLKAGTALTAANVDQAWKGLDAGTLFAEKLSRGAEDVVLLNDADAAGLAEINHGAGETVNGVVVLLTFGTGIGSALFLDGKLVPNTEFGHLEVDGADAETHASASAKDEHGWSYEVWADNVTRYLRMLEGLIWPDLIIAGGEVSKSAEKWLPLLRTRCRVVPASLQNDAGIVGAANAAQRGFAR